MEDIYGIDPIEWPASHLGSSLTISVSAINKSKQKQNTVRNVSERYFPRSGCGKYRAMIKDPSCIIND